ncbi:eukaryotic translation initiation factor 3 subunit K [Homalodisca vitripennis]|uniref:Eukaryotic translation initiation factor 3 subunit K n=1 Tax=Homalodisca liturata TaxID=320908 RepID=A0A1B6IH47_9HEMI|nr:eukaryotic translation initiation factor 3 subunit K [Homalodisca vitripennis]KAG8320881.1 Eukaryotic translation initiation factor 3 subunit K [Homalodisca vitripennis]
MTESRIEQMKQTIASKVKGIEMYNPENLKTFELYVEMQSQENVYDLEANLVVLKFYQFSQKYDIKITSQILLKALTNFPHTDFILCKCLLNEQLCKEHPINQIIYLADLLECCDLQMFWEEVYKMSDLCSQITGFNDSIRKFVCHVVGISFQSIQRSLLAQLLGGVDDNDLRFWVQKYGWKEEPNNIIFIANQDENVKTKNITEKIDFDNVANLMASCR